MAIDRAEAARIAELARLYVPDSELDRVAVELSKVLEFAATLNELELSDEPLTAFAPPEAALREDAPDGRTLDAETALANAPEAEGGFFLVPPVVEDLEP
jgi:aspartyl-tRNA(Asn)/glutamyl-tRNA(Gln) amidotransferase subunit C